MPVSEKPSLAALVVLGSALAVLVIGGLLLRSRHANLATQTGDAGVTSRESVPPRTSALTARLGTPVRRSGPDEIFATSLVSLRASGTTGGARSALVALAAHLRSLPPAEAARQSIAFLDSGEDVSTRLPFTLQKDGDLASAPTLRTFLLDFLSQLDPAGAADYARKILARPDSADEWAIALRSFAKLNSDPTAKEYLAGKFRELASQAAWRNDPSVGFLESFDLPVHLADPSLLPVLGELLAGPAERATTHAAALALDRLSVGSPGLVLSAWQADPGLLANAPEVRASSFSRADASDPRQRAALEGYLASPSVSTAEARAFADSFPNRSYRISNNLLTTTPTPTREQIVAGDRAALNALNEWVRDPRFAAYRELLVRARDRVADYVRQAARP